MTSSDMQAKLEIKELYNEQAANYHAIFQKPAGRYFMKRKLDTLAQLAPFPSGSQLLEVGCANGVFTRELARRGFEMIGLDLSPACIETATQLAKESGLDNTRFIVGDAENLSQLEDNTFDGVISFSALRYVARADKAIREIYRVLKPGGLAVVDFPNKLSPWFTIIKPLVTRETHIHDHHYTTSQVRRMFEDAGFEHIQQRLILYTAKIIPSWSLPVMKLVDNIGERTPGVNQFAAIIMTRGYKT